MREEGEDRDCELERKRVGGKNWCFTPSKQLRLYQLTLLIDATSSPSVRQRERERNERM